MLFAWKKYLVEFIGTLVLGLTIVMALMSVGPNGLSILMIPVLAGLTLALFITTVGQGSQTHLNPATTVGMFIFGKTDWRDALLYIIAQFAGAGVAIAVAMAFVPEPGLMTILGQLSATLPNSLPIGIAEAIGAFVFGLGIAAVAYGRVQNKAAGVVMGASYFLGIMLALILGSSGLLNPAVALTVSAFKAMYIVGPVVGMLAGVGFMSLLESNNMNLAGSREVDVEITIEN